MGRSNGTRTLKLVEAFERERVRVDAEIAASDSINHGGDKGEANERVFIECLRKYLPNRYTVAKATVIDSLGSFSDSIDIVVFDHQYTPTLFDNNQHRYVPAEAVYAVFECKSSISASNLKYAASKAQSVRRLHRTSSRIFHAGGEYGPKPQFPILGGILARRAVWADGLGGSFRRVVAGLTDDLRLDLGLAVSDGAFDTFDSSDSLIVHPREGALAMFVFRFLSKLQEMGTAPAPDWRAYADALSRSPGKV